MRKLFYSSCYLIALPVWLLAGIRTSFSQHSIVFAHQQIPIVSGDSENETMLLREALKLLESRYRVDIVFGDRIVQNFSVLSSRVLLKGSLEESLNRILESTGLKYKKLEGRSYAILAKGDKRRQSQVKAPDISEHTIPETTTIIPPQSENKTIPDVERRVKGQVASEDGLPLPGVSILVKGTQRGMITDVNGEFSIEVPSENSVLVFSFVGFVGREETVGARSTIEISLEEDKRALEELIVVGYGTQKKSEITGAISSIKGEDLTKLATQRVDQALQGRAAGIMVLNSDGAPGGNTTIRIRGMNSIQGGNDALIVIDGFQGGDLRSLNPNDIQSIEVLKDASATAIYGARGANGVVLVQTKKGQSTTPKISYSSDWSPN